MFKNVNQKIGVGNSRHMSTVNIYHYLADHHQVRYEQMYMYSKWNKFTIKTVSCVNSQQSTEISPLGPVMMTMFNSHG